MFAPWKVQMNPEYAPLKVHILVIKCTLEGAFCGIICTLESANFIMEPTSAV